MALVLALDGSASVRLDGFGLIAGGAGAALRDPEVVAALTQGGTGHSVVAVVLWSGRDAQALLADWTPVASQADADRLGQEVEDAPRLVRAGLTAIGSALERCGALLEQEPARPARRRIVDVAGDGRSNDGPPPGPVRDRLAAAGITVNGLCVLNEEPDLLESYERDVIGGPGAFAVTCPDLHAFAEAMRRKLLRELVA